MPSHPFPEYRDTPLWSAIEESLNELVATHELTVNTAPDYVIGYLCQELFAKKVVAVATPGRGREGPIGAHAAKPRLSPEPPSAGGS